MITNSVCKETFNTSIPEKVNKTNFVHFDTTIQVSDFQKPLFTSRNIHLRSRNYTVAKHSHFNLQTIKL